MRSDTSAAVNLSIWRGSVPDERRCVISTAADHQRPESPAPESRLPRRRCPAVVVAASSRSFGDLAGHEPTSHLATWRLRSAAIHRHRPRRYPRRCFDCSLRRRVLEFSSPRPAGAGSEWVRRRQSCSASSPVERIASPSSAGRSPRRSDCIEQSRPERGDVLLALVRWRLIQLQARSCRRRVCWS